MVNHTALKEWRTITGSREHVTDGLSIYALHWKGMGNLGMVVESILLRQAIEATCSSMLRTISSSSMLRTISSIFRWRRWGVV